MTAPGDRGYVFVVGCARSGTTLLSRILGRSDEVFVSPETKYFHTVWSQRHILSLLPPALRTRRVVDCLIDSEYPADPPLFPARRSEIERAIAASANLRDAFPAVLASLSPAPVLGEKSPWHAFFVDEMLASAPGARAVAIVRDAPAVVASLLGRPGFRRVATLAQCAARWRLANEEIVHLARRLPPHVFRVVRFEDVIEDPETEVRGLCAWLGIRFDPAMLSPTGQDSSLRRGGGQGGLDEGALTRWRERLSDAQVRRVRALTAPVARRLGYERDDVPADHREPAL